MMKLGSPLRRVKTTFETALLRLDKDLPKKGRKVDLRVVGERKI